MAKRRPESKYIQISAKIRRNQHKWINNQCDHLGISRNQYFELLFNGLMKAQKETETQGTFMYDMVDEISKVVVKRLTS